MALRYPDQIPRDLFARFRRDEFHHVPAGEPAIIIRFYQAESSIVAKEDFSGKVEDQDPFKGILYKRPELVLTLLKFLLSPFAIGYIAGKAHKIQDLSRRVPHRFTSGSEPVPVAGGMADAA